MKNAVFWDVAPNVGSIHKIYTAPHPRRPHSSNSFTVAIFRTKKKLMKMKGKSGVLLNHSPLQKIAFTIYFEMLQKI
jgi:hypothetical protein